MGVTLHIVDLWQYYVCCIRSGAISYTIFMPIDLSRMCQYGLHAVLWSLSVHFTPLPIAVPRRTTGLLFLSRLLCGMSMVTMYSMVLNRQVLKSKPVFFYRTTLLTHFSSFFYAHFLSLFFLSLGLGQGHLQYRPGCTTLCG